MQTMENISLSNLSRKDFLRRICVIASRHSKKDNSLKAGEIKKAKTALEKEMMEKIHGLEMELQAAKEEKERALNENRNMINELNAQLLSVKIKIDDLIAQKKEREAKIRNLERKIRSSQRNC
ncbi:hypothetical protein HYX01_00970 [Candidatus Woesearchaeota archaeon]|nr:hypothetical protein [Candidatus Woesearchaeota archaeon]